MIKSIGFDIDGTLVDEIGYSIQSFLSYYKEKKGKAYSGKIDPSQMHFLDRFPDADTAFLKEFEAYHYDHYFKDCELRPYVKELFERLRKLGVVIHIITARYQSEGSKYNEEDIELLTKNLFERNGVHVDYYHIGLAEKDSIIKGNGIEIMVEDSPEMAEKCSYVCPVLLVDSPTNRLCMGKNIWRIENFMVEPFLKTIDYVMKNKEDWSTEFILPEKEFHEDVYVEAAVAPQEITQSFSMAARVYVYGKEMVDIHKVNKIAEFLKTKDKNFIPMKGLKESFYKIKDKKTLGNKLDKNKGDETNKVAGTVGEFLGLTISEYSSKDSGEWVFRYLITNKGALKNKLQKSFYFQINPKYKKYEKYYTAAISAMRRFPVDEISSWVDTMSKKLGDSVTEKERKLLKDKPVEESCDWFESEEPLYVEVIDEVNGIVRLNPESSSNIIFIIPFNNPDTAGTVANIMKENNDVIHLNLSLIEEPVENIDSNPENEIIIQAIKTANRKKVDLTNPNSTDAYIIKCKIMKLILDTCSRYKKTYVLDGVQTLMLPRDVTDKFKDSLIYLEGLSKASVTKIINNKYRANYNPFILLEDLTEVSTQIRKWKIIAGTAKKELPNYINRQTTTSEGVDIVQLLPDEAPYKPDLLESILSMNTYLLGDVHLSTKNKEKTERIINAINKTCTKDDHLVFLGDFDGKKGTGSYDLVKTFLRRLRCKNIYLVLGNNDPYTIKQYKELGFLSVVDLTIFKDTTHRNIILTHCPYPVKNGEINIHGHIHGSRTYWNMDWRDHYDVWNEDFVPIKISTCLEILEKGLYHAKSEVHNINESHEDYSVGNVFMEKATREQYRMSAFKKKYHYNPKDRTIVVDGEKYKIDLDVKKATATIDEPFLGKITVARNMQVQLNSDDPMIILTDEFFKLKNSKRRDAVLQHEVAHTKLHSTNPNGRHIDKNAMSKKRYHEIINAEVHHLLKNATREDKKAYFNSIESGYGYDDYLAARSEDVAKRKIHDAALQAFKKFEGKTQHANVIEMEADDYAAKKSGKGNLKKGLRELNKYSTDKTAKKMADADANIFDKKATPADIKEKKKELNKTLADDYNARAHALDRKKK